MHISSHPQLYSDFVDTEGREPIGRDWTLYTGHIQVNTLKHLLFPHLFVLSLH